MRYKLILLFAVSTSCLLPSCRKDDTPPPLVPTPIVDSVDPGPDISGYTPKIVGAHVWRGIIEQNDHRAGANIDTVYNGMTVFSVRAISDRVLSFSAQNHSIMDPYQGQDTVSFRYMNDSEIVFGNLLFRKKELHYNYKNNTLTYLFENSEPEYSFKMELHTQIKDLSEWAYLAAGIAGPRRWMGLMTKYYAPPGEDSVYIADTVASITVSSITISSGLFNGSAYLFAADSLYMQFVRNYYDSGPNQLYRVSTITYYPQEDKI